MFEHSMNGARARRERALPRRPARSDLNGSNLNDSNLNSNVIKMGMHAGRPSAPHLQPVRMLGEEGRGAGGRCQGAQQDLNGQRACFEFESGCTEVEGGAKPCGAHGQQDLNGHLMHSA